MATITEQQTNALSCPVMAIKFRYNAWSSILDLVVSFTILIYVKQKS